MATEEKTIALQYEGGDRQEEGERRNCKNRSEKMERRTCAATPNDGNWGKGQSDGKKTFAGSIESKKRGGIREKGKRTGKEFPMTPIKSAAKKGRS